MLQILGACMILLGTIGLGYTLIEKEQKIICLMERWEHVMQMFSSEITYKKQPLNLACWEIGEKIGGKEGCYLKEIANRMQENQRSTFNIIWEEECRKYSKKEKITKESAKLLEEFGVLTGFDDENIQKYMIEEQKEKWKHLRLRRQEEYQERKRLIRILSTCMGLILIIILW